MKNWKTTACGVLQIIAAVSGAGVMLLDDNPATNPDWNLVYGAIALAIGLIVSGAASVFSADAKK